MLVRNGCWGLLLASTLALSCGGNPQVEPGPAATSTAPSSSSGGSGHGPILHTSGGKQTCQGACGGQGGDPGIAVVCGDSKLGEGETCDDGNATPGDGCSGLCRTEGGYECLTPGKPCKPTLFCGDKKPGPNEVCDDGNAATSDGCTPDCQLEPGFTCTAAGVCTRQVTASVCGNAKVESGEQCDDGGVVPGDGCSASCQQEDPAHYVCPPGAPCVPLEFCGDGLLNGTESCDDGNLENFDCCSTACRVEPNCACTPPDPQLVPQQTCATTIVCGDGKVVGFEACDDANTTGADGCSADCRTVEPGFTCPTPGQKCVAAVAPCGNGAFDTNETCDDGNAIAGDGCSGNCKVEPGYVCPTLGQKCQPKESCGDGLTSPANVEGCDDGNATANDGCSASCQVEAGWDCDNKGGLAASVCVFTVKCGDKKIGVGEICDDGNQISGDGCSSNCKNVEPGFACPKAGSVCLAVCGDDVLKGRETCDDGNTTNGDGCSGACHTEPTYTCPPSILRPNPTPLNQCIKTVCGDGYREGDEPCDDADKNKNTGDGCTPLCEIEPTCTAGACQSRCGDGMILAGDVEECDDGNTQNGDGCSATCTKEAGFTCTIVAKTPPATLQLPVLYRDFNRAPKAGFTKHPDFETYSGDAQTPGLINSNLPADRRPVATGNCMVACGGGGGQPACGAACPYKRQLTSLADFAQWYTDTPASKRIDSVLSIPRQPDGSYVFDTGVVGFYPIDGQGWVASGAEQASGGHNFGFTTSLLYWFELKGGEQLAFSGDDDVWIFINGKLMVDLGGLHPPTSGSITLTDAKIATLGMTKGRLYEIVLLHAERHTDGSNFKLTLNGFNVRNSVCAPVCGDGQLVGDEACDLGVANGASGGYGGCTASCELEPFCGDGFKNGPEYCDDGVNTTAYGTQASGCAPGCVQAHRCGDGLLDATYGEVCDLGAGNSPAAYGTGACNDRCQPGHYCGDGLLDGAESCDDGQANGTLSSPCDTGCRVKCGNGTVELGEECDLGTALNVGGYNGCSATCVRGSYCGDGIKDAGEQCDDGKNDGTYDTCAPGCLKAPFCGDGVTQLSAGELCDLGASNVTSGYGLGKCTTRCRATPYCGDGMVDLVGGEKCDDGAGNSATQPGACKPDCSAYNQPPATCGNKKLDAGEQCDDGAGLNGTAASKCDSRCLLKCGNGLKDAGEQCDDGNNTGAYGTCAADCTLAPYCGDGVKNGTEACDRGPDNALNAYGVGTCTTNCRLGGYCGDGRVQTANSEQCDGTSNCTSGCRYSILH